MRSAHVCYQAEACMQQAFPQTVGPSSLILSFLGSTPHFLKVLNAPSPFFPGSLPQKEEEISIDTSVFLYFL